MNLNAAALRLMAEKGLTLSDVAEIVAANEAKADTTAAERQRRCRANKKAGNMSQRDVTRDPPIEYNHTPSDYPSETKASLAPRGKTRKATRLPENWEPEPLDIDTAAIVLRWMPGRLERERARFRDYWMGKAGRSAAKMDWQATWRNWLRNADDWNKDKQNGQSGNQMGSTERAARQALYELNGGAGRFDEGGGGLPPGIDAAGHRTIDALPDTVRAIGHVQ